MHLASLAPEAAAAEALSANAVGTGISQGARPSMMGPGALGGGISSYGAPQRFGDAGGSGIGARVSAADLPSSPFASANTSMMAMGPTATNNPGLGMLGLMGANMGMQAMGNKGAAPMQAPMPMRLPEQLQAGAFQAASPYVRMMASRGLR